MHQKQIMTPTDLVDWFQKYNPTKQITDDVLASQTIGRVQAALNNALTRGCTVAAGILLTDKRIEPIEDEGHLRLMLRDDSIKLLLNDQRVDPMAYDNMMLYWAVASGKEETVKLLLAHLKMDPKAVAKMNLKPVKSGLGTEMVKYVKTWLAKR